MANNDRKRVRVKIERRVRANKNLFQGARKSLNEQNRVRENARLYK